MAKWRPWLIAPPVVLGALLAAVLLDQAGALPTRPAAVPEPPLARPAELAPTTDAEIAATFNSRVETRLDADVTGDGLLDTVAVIRSDDGGARSLQLLGSYRDGSVARQGLTDGAWLDPEPGRRAVLSLEAGLLVVTDWAGDPPAVAEVLRLRFDRHTGELAPAAAD